MADSSQSPRKRDGHELAIRNVVDFAHEVRIHLYDERVIFGSVAPAALGETGTFRIRPWGISEARAIAFDDVSLASPVKQMGWERHRAIAVAQQAGIFGTVRKPGGATSVAEAPTAEASTAATPTAATPAAGTLK
jgi:hypothetical protein